MGQPYDPYGSYGPVDPYAAGPQQQPYYQAPPGPPVQHRYYGAMPVAPPTNGMAIASLVLGIAGILTCGLTSIPAVICGHVAQNQIKRTGEGGQGSATAGLILGYVFTVLWTLYWIFVFGMYGIALWSVSHGGTSTSTY